MNKTIAISFLKKITKGNHDRAFAEYVRPGGSHHNLWTAPGMQALKE